MKAYCKEISWIVNAIKRPKTTYEICWCFFSTNFLHFQLVYNRSLLCSLRMHLEMHDVIGWFNFFIQKFSSTLIQWSFWMFTTQRMAVSYQNQTRIYQLCFLKFTNQLMFWKFTKSIDCLAAVGKERQMRTPRRFVCFFFVFASDFIRSDHFISVSN